MPDPASPVRRALRFVVGSGLLVGLGACDRANTPAGDTKAKDEHSEGKPRVNEGPAHPPEPPPERTNVGREDPVGDPPTIETTNVGRVTPPEEAPVEDHVNEGPVKPPPEPPSAESKAPPSPKVNPGPTKTPN